MNDTPIADVIVVGSGAAGSWAALALAERGVRTVLLEAGRSLDPERDFPPPPPHQGGKLQLVSRARAVLGSQPVQARCMSFAPLTRHLFVSDRENPYVTPRGERFNWFRGRQVGGRLHLWGRNALRISDADFKAAERDGFGPSWPIGYADLEPWYDRVEEFLGVHGTAAGIASIPDGRYVGPLRITDLERQVLTRLRQAWPERPATTTRIVSHNPERIPTPILAAQRTGNLRVISDAVVSRVESDPESGRATGVSWVDRTSGTTHTLSARAVVLCASTIETLRILLNSRSPRHPAGLGNSSGTLGRYITDHVMIFQAGPVDAPLDDLRDDPYDFGAQSGIYVPSFRNRPGAPPADGFLRGYSLLGSVGRIPPGWFFMAIGEMLPRHDNFVSLDAARRDAWGIPVARIRCTHGENERAMVRDMHRTMAELTAACGLVADHLQREGLLARTVYRAVSSLVYTPEGALVPGSAVHEAGGAAMGENPATSVLNTHNQVWDAPNVYVTDSAAFPTSPFQNPGLTIMALSARAGHHLADALRDGEL